MQRATLISPEREGTLLEQIRAGDDGAFREVYVAMYAPLRSFAFVLTRDDGAAHDTVQEVLFAFWHHRAKIDVRDRFVPYLYKGVRNQCAKFRRHEQIVRRVEAVSPNSQMIPGMSEERIAVDASLEHAEQQSALRAAIEELPDRQRAILTLYLTDALDTTEIAEALGVTSAAVLMGLSRARATLRDVLGKFER
jgi:RNA polymerase sigma-70 factor (ECF subfamily)